MKNKLIFRCLFFFPVHFISKVKPVFPRPAEIHEHLWQRSIWLVTKLHMGSVVRFLCVRLDYRLILHISIKFFKQTRFLCDPPRYGRVMESEVSNLPATETWTGMGSIKVVHTTLCQITHRNANYSKQFTGKKWDTNKQTRAIQMIPER